MINRFKAFGWKCEKKNIHPVGIESTFTWDELYRVRIESFFFLLNSDSPASGRAHVYDGRRKILHVKLKAIENPSIWYVFRKFLSRRLRSVKTQSYLRGTRSHPSSYFRQNQHIIQWLNGNKSLYKLALKGKMFYELSNVSRFVAVTFLRAQKITPHF